MAVSTPPWISRKVFSFDDIQIEGRDRANAEYFFNPAIFLTVSGKYRFLGRYVAGGRRDLIALPLDRNLSFSSLEAERFSEAVKPIAPQVSWFADPRHFRFAGRDYVAFNNGQNPIPNDIFVVGLDSEGNAKGPIYKAVKTDGRQPLEKNWGFFDHAGRLYCVYSINPFVILSCEFSGETLFCRTAFEHHWYSEAYESVYGEAHGGTCPVLIDGRWHMVVQSRYPKDRERVYYSTLLSFENEEPFRPTAFSNTPLMALADEELSLRGVKDLNAHLKSCIYPCGFLHEKADDTILVSYGINDFASGARRYEREALMSGLREIRSVERRYASAGAPPETARTPKQLRTFFWNARASTNQPFKFGNVGDQLEELLVSHLFGAEPIHDETSGKRMLGVGSISHRLLRGDLVWGSGFRNVPMKLAPGDAETIDVRAVRGPLTLEYLKKNGVRVDTVEHFFDPGLLIGEIFKEQFALLRKQVQRTSTIAFVPHHQDRQPFVAQYGRLGLPIINVDSGLMNFCAALLSTTLVVASSLHGIILAEALGIPALMHKPMAGEQIEKFFDYYYGTNRMTFPVIESFPDIVAAQPPQLPKLKCQDWLATAPTSAELETLGILKNA